MNIFFDIQGTLVAAGTARPHVREVFLTLTEEGHHVYLWTGGGLEYAKRIAEFLEINDIISGCVSKADRPPVKVDFVVDDEQSMIETYGGHTVSLFIGDPNDDELWKVVESVRRVAN
ncbi:MAG: HAD family hydrolase [Rubrobacteraceae bacterium]